MDTRTGLALDSRSLDGLKRDAVRDPKAAVRRAAGQFEALFMQQLLKSMRDSIPKSGLMEGSGHEVYVGMLDQQFAQALSGRPGGLGEVIARQLERRLQPATATADDATGAQGQGGLKGIPGSDRRLDGAPAMIRSPIGPSSTVLPTGGAVIRSTTAPGGAVGAAAEATAARDAQALGKSLSASLAQPQREFVDKVWQHAVAAERQTGVPASFVVGQAALESGWGRQEMRLADGRPSHNVFGIKAGAGWKGATVEALTTEYVDGKARKVVERFRAYGSYREAFTDWANLLSSQPRYAGVLRAGGNAEGFAAGMQRAGYATDPRYAEKLERTIGQALRARRLTV